MKTLALFSSLALSGLLLTSPAQAQGRNMPDPGSFSEPLIVEPDQVPNFRRSMRAIVGEISSYAKTRDPNFLVLVRDGLELAQRSDREVQLDEFLAEGRDDVIIPSQGTLERVYLRAVDGFVLDGTFCGRDEWDRATSAGDTEDTLALAQTVRREGPRMLTVEHCGKADLRSNAHRRAASANMLAYAEGGQQMATIPSGRPWGENAESVMSLAAARNFLLHEDSRSWDSRADWIAALRGTNHDLLIVNPFHRMADPLTREEVQKLKYKSLGSRRLVFASMSLGIARETGFYWNKDWRLGNPAWLSAPATVPGSYVVDYEAEPWKDILGRTIAGIMDLGFDGVMLEDADAYLFWEARMPLNFF
ncbi:hypothetical protein [Telmatospirillum sp. J64-1]|uniref:hypothetical protein n=1 Tax=Telmatospirillum sp. J64-1 TaxID=2502183 RepID=UPI00115E8B6D|nr:hypothetical protein [Telmatospirillum sp. J64-1]